MYVRHFEIRNTICLLLYLLTRNLNSCSYHICPIFILMWYLSALKVNYIYIIHYFLYALYLRPAAHTQVFLRLFFVSSPVIAVLIDESVNWFRGSHFRWVKLHCEIWGYQSSCTPEDGLGKLFQNTDTFMLIYAVLFLRKYDSWKFEFFFRTFLLTYSLTPRSRVLLEKLVFSQIRRTFRLKFTYVYFGRRICL